MKPTAKMRTILTRHIDKIPFKTHLKQYTDSKISTIYCRHRYFTIFYR